MLIQIISSADIKLNQLENVPQIFINVLYICSMKGTMLDIIEDAEIINIFLIIRPLCLVGKIRNTESLQIEAENNMYHTRGEKNILC